PLSCGRRRLYVHRLRSAMPGWGGMSVLDRSWYGRVLVERVEGLATEQEWRRAYPQIFQWGGGLATEGAVIVKLWLEISEDEQLRRLRAREPAPPKPWELTTADLR